MTESDLEIVRRGVEAFIAGAAQGDPGAAFDLPEQADDLEFFTPPGFPGPASYRGREGFEEFMRLWTEDFADWSMALGELTDLGEGRILARLGQRAVGKVSGAPVELETATIYEIEGGRIVRIRNYLDVAHARQAIGLPE